MATFSSLLPALVDVLETSQKQDGHASKQALLHSTNEFKEILTRAKALAANLPGGDMSLSDQDEVIQMLQKLRDYKRQDRLWNLWNRWLIIFDRAQLSLFSRLTMSGSENEEGNK
ncbi:hypothetical protein JB92DRAFT_3008037 [Gautieria morchelliformis]|nr:hypothetical protein JB92DRAFT_3008037 [Gautieria morchelliformis]